MVKRKVVTIGNWLIARPFQDRPQPKSVMQDNSSSNRKLDNALFFLFKFSHVIVKSNIMWL